LEAGDAAVVVVILIVAVPDGPRPDHQTRQTIAVWAAVVAIHAVA